MHNIETLLSQKQARQSLVQSQMKSLNDEYMPLRIEKEELEEEIEKLEEELQKIDDVQTDARFDEIIADLNEPVDEELPEAQRSPEAWSHADDENDNDR